MVKKINNIRVKIEYIEEARDIKLNHPTKFKALSFLKKELDCDREKVIRVDLNAQLKLISYEVVTIGSGYYSHIHPREFFKGAILMGANAVIMVHNHPSGSEEISTPDVKLTERIKRSGDILGIELLDSLIYANGKFISLRSKGYFDKFEFDKSLNEIKSLDFLRL